MSLDENNSGSYPNSLMSKAPELVQQNENGITFFDGLFVDNVQLPREYEDINLIKEKEKSAKVKITISNHPVISRSSSRVLLRQESTTTQEPITC
jgi:hypothetical protein